MSKPPLPVGAAPERDQLIRQAVADALSRFDRGEVVHDAQVIADHPELMPELAEALRVARAVRNARHFAHTAGPEARALEALTESQLEAPIEVPSIPVNDLVEPDSLPQVQGYTVIEQIRRGGQAAVFKAVQQATGRRVALKVIPGGAFVNSDSRARFNREAAILAELNHPYIVTILDRGNTADGSLFLAMNYVEGQSLDAVAGDMTRTALADPRPLLRIFVTIARAVEAAHARGIVHRDLKPANIRIDTRGEPRVLDFGLARLTDPSLAAELSTVSPTITGQIVGSVPWASPEQASGRSKVDARSDVYSLGVMLYQLLTGEFPYPISGTMREVLDNIQTALPRRPSHVAGGPAGQRWGLLAPALDSVVLKALEKSPERRYASAGVLAAELDRCVSEIKPHARRDREAILRRRWLWVAVAVALGFLCLGEELALKALERFHRPATTGQVTVLQLPTFVDSLGLHFVKVPAGVAYFTKGPINVPQPFYLATTEVTQKQYESIMGVNPTPPVWRNPEFAVSGVAASDAVEFCRRMGQREKAVYRLPTEVEWEYASRAGTIGKFAGTGRLDGMGFRVVREIKIP